MIWGLVARLNRDGHQLSVRAIARIHQIIDESLPDQRDQGSQHDLMQLVRERMQRDR